VELGCIVSIFLFYRKEPTLTKYFAYATLPFALVLFLITTFGILDFTGINLPDYFFILMTNLLLISNAWVILFFTWVLFKQFENQRKDVAETKLQVERMAKEKEIERLELIEKQKSELETKVNERTSELNRSLQELKVTQSQLIQSEKMASLGELTAGIAHEIQNPLNFVNNFSDLNTELIDELKSELTNGNMQLAIELANDIKKNEQKISHHGKRADAIVKGMLQHSRSSNGQKESTDINALTDEYLRLAYHGLRAKDKSFNVNMNTDFDESIGNINIIPQDIGRVVLNLITNAFYAVNERLEKAKAIGDKTYEPTVAVKTKNLGETIQICIIDNGGGIPQNVIDKIFQPFFTTKPTGEGTGLGLSLSYDIIKAHGGEIKVETSEETGTTFKILLNNNQN
jgi:signal transduction histidine kinase